MFPDEPVMAPFGDEFICPPTARCLASFGEDSYIHTHTYMPTNTRESCHRSHVHFLKYR